MPLRITTFNVLHESMRNFSARWAARRPLVAETIRSIEPDIACLQEVSSRQLEDLRLDLPAYDFIEGTASGATKLPAWASGMVPAARLVLGDFYDAGELCPILMRRGRVHAAQHGSFWVSQHPEGSRTFLGGTRTPHIVNWARVEDSSGQQGCFVYNTHLGLVPWTARRTAKELIERLDRDWNHEAQILVGDFNSTPAGPVIRALLQSRSGGLPAFHDVWVEARLRDGPGSTYHWAFGLPGPRLDYILVRPPYPVLSASTASVRRGHIFASDHHALTAELDV
jgi:endonuclease/exonuclease/phosphatase family metal-dependent hydrolase